MRRFEMIMIFFSFSKLTTSATQFGLHEWLMYLHSEIELLHSNERWKNNMMLDRYKKIIRVRFDEIELNWIESNCKLLFNLPCRSTGDCGVYYVVGVEAEHVDAAVGSLVLLFAFFRDLGSNNLADVFNHHRTRFDIAARKQTQALKRDKIVIKTPILNNQTLFCIFNIIYQRHRKIRMLKHCSRVLTINMLRISITVKMEITNKESKTD